ncbi:30S ribosomal protein S8 [Blattabacterium cuenoti]|uniref:30S ribosomal protein S8 n=1 Tax=Blattabacterium cuenoti TaxID=1653831 RepID=UPI00163BD08C|nr:30S ribosomal protein S8 [Blattabacterium cuenoti]
MDSIANFLTMIRNASNVGHKILVTELSKIKENISIVLLKNGYILGYKIEKEKNLIKLALKYYKNKPVIKNLIRISKPGLRIYCKYKKLPRVLNGLGIAIVSTSHGIMSDKSAKKNKIGGEILCYVY